MQTPVHITAFYKFTPIDRKDIGSIQKKLQKFGRKKGMRGLVLIAEEGLNGTVCGEPKVIEKWKKMLEGCFGDIVFKDSTAKECVFPRWFVKVRDEVVTLRENRVNPSGRRNHLTPEEWHKMMEEDVVVIDTRNDYETDVGLFMNALDLKLKTFQEFPDAVKKSKIPKDKKVLMYCTGGIRCEKALLEMEKQGYKNVYQLEGGILAYLEKFPNKKFKGECFVFDHRVSVDQELKPSERYSLCPHCGDPGDCNISCNRCKERNVICYRCKEQDHLQTCSKDCSYHLQRSGSPVLSPR